jgi:hypothetical protein
MDAKTEIRRTTSLIEDDGLRKIEFAFLYFVEEMCEEASNKIKELEKRISKIEDNINVL